MTTKSKLAPSDYGAMRALLDWMAEHSAEGGFVWMTTTTIYQLVFANANVGYGPDNTLRFTQDYLPVLRQLGCIQIQQLQNDGPKAKPGTPPKKTIPVCQVTGKELTQEMWDAYWVALDPLAAERARNAELQAENDRLRAELEEARLRQ